MMYSYTGAQINGGQKREEPWRKTIFETRQAFHGVARK